MEDVVIRLGQGRQPGIQFSVDEAAPSGGGCGPSAIFEDAIFKLTVIKVRKFEIALLKRAITENHLLNVAGIKHTRGESY